jgi:hypothetical protein
MIMSKADLCTTPIRSRRTVLAGLASAAALPVVAAIPTAAPAMDFPVAPIAPTAPADLELVELANQLIAAAAESRRLDQIAGELSCISYRIQPFAGMEVRSSDAELGIPLPDQTDEYLCGFYGGAAVNKIRQPKWLDCKKVGEDADNLAMTFRNITPSAEARARADEIVAAYDEWEAAKEKKPRGFKAAIDAYDKAESIETRLEQKIHSIRATTIEGMTAKARCAELYYFEGGVVDNFSESIAKDLLALSGRGKAVTR